MKVIVTGAYSTGKTTLVGDLVGELSKLGLTVGVVSDVSRGCPLPLNKSQTENTSLWLLFSQLAHELESLPSGTNVLLCDRGIPDVLAHHEEMRRRQKAESMSLLKPFLLKWLKSYDLILFSRVDQLIPIEPDGLRVEDPKYRTLLDQYAAEVLADLTNVRELPFGQSSRVSYACDLIVRGLSGESAIKLERN